MKSFGSKYEPIPDGMLSDGMPCFSMDEDDNEESEHVKIVAECRELIADESDYTESELAALAISIAFDIFVEDYRIAKKFLKKKKSKKIPKEWKNEYLRFVARKVCGLDIALRHYHTLP